MVDGGVLPDDVLVEILLTLPLYEEHHGFQYSVCKQDGDIPFICYGPEPDLNNRDLHLCLFSKQNQDDPLNLIPDLLRDSAPSFATNPDSFNKAYFIGAVNGVVCIIWGFNDIGLWNPATREFKAISPWLYRPIKLFYLGIVGFGFDCASNDFKIIRGNVSEDGTHNPEVYSLTSNTWKSVTVPSPFVIGCRSSFMQAYLNGVCYWHVSPVPSGPAQIISFNFATEVLEMFDQPQIAIDSDVGGHEWAITLYKERLAFVVIHTEESDWEEVVRSLDVWVVTKNHDNSGNPVAWERLFTIGPFMSLSNVRYFDTFTMDGEVFFTVGGPSTGLQASLYNPSTDTFNHFGFFIGSFWGYVGSLFRLSKKVA